MTRIVRTATLLLLIVANGVASDEPRGTPEEAKAMVARAIAACDARGETAFAAITPPGSDFRDRDLYVFVIGPDNRTVAHGQDASRIGNDLAQTVDAAGKAFGREMIEKADEKGVWVDYIWRDPLTNTDAEKTSWVVRHDGYIFGCGVYKP